MSSRNAGIVVLVLVAASLLVLALSALGILPGREPGPVTGDETSSAYPSQSDTSPTSTDANTQPLTISFDEPEATSSTGLRRWPAESSLPIIHAADLTIYTGRTMNDQPLAGITVILDAGHGGQDGGAVVSTSNGKLAEKDITLAVARLARNELETLGATVIMTRETDAWQSIYSRIAMASQQIVARITSELPARGYSGCDVFDRIAESLDEMLTVNSDTEKSGGRGLMQGFGVNADTRVLMDAASQYADVLFISLHCNSLDSDSSVHGMQVYYLTGETIFESENSECQGMSATANPPAYSLIDDANRLRLAQCVHDSIFVRQPDLEFHGEADIIDENYALLREVNLVSVLVEMGFITNDNDQLLMTGSEGQTSIAQGVAEAVWQYYCG